MLTHLLYYLGCWFYVIFICLSVMIIMTFKVVKLMLNVITGKKMQNLIDYHPDIFLNHYQYMTLPGYQIKQYKVKTDDGCELVLWRILNINNKSEQKRIPALIMHGLLDCGTTWFAQQDLKNSLPYVLQLKGYDVWIGNNRGNRYTRNNIDNDKFWLHTFDELAKYDITKIVSTVLQQTKSESLVFVGHSQGSLQMMAAITEGFLAQQKIKAFVGLGPVLSVFNNTSSLLLKALSNLPIVETLMWLGFKTTLHLPSWSTRALAVLMCNSSFIGEFAFFVVNFFSGFSKTHKLSYKQLARIISNEPGGGSLQSIIHWKQFTMNEKIKYFDYGKTKNLEIYNRETPPEYNFHKIMNINFHKLVFIGTSDVFMKHSLISREYYNKNAQTVIIQDYNHNDYIWSATGKEVVYDYVVQFLQKYA